MIPRALVRRVYTLYACGVNARQVEIKQFNYIYVHLGISSKYTLKSEFITEKLIVSLAHTSMMYTLPIAFIQCNSNMDTLYSVPLVSDFREIPHPYSVIMIVRG